MTLERYEASFNRVFRSYKKNADRKGLKFELSKDTFKRIAEKNCQYCGAEPTTVSHHSRFNGAWAFNGIDRIDNKKGYLYDNVQPCCSLCNKIKSDLEETDFLQQVCRIVSHTQIKDD